MEGLHWTKKKSKGIDIEKRKKKKKKKETIGNKMNMC